MAAVRADTPEPGLRIIQSVKLTSAAMMKSAALPHVVIYQLVKEVMAEVPDADFIEVRAIRYDVEGDASERSVSPVPPGE